MPEKKRCASRSRRPSSVSAVRSFPVEFFFKFNPQSIEGEMKAGDGGGAKLKWPQLEY